MKTPLEEKMLRTREALADGAEYALGALIAAAMFAGLLLFSPPVKAQPSPQFNQTQVFGAWTRIGRAPDLTAGTATSSTILNFAGAVARVCNTGVVNAYVNLGGASVTAVLATSTLVPAGICISMNATGATYIAGITGSSTAVVQTELGTGMASLGGGSGGGGSGSAVSSVFGRTGAIVAATNDYTIAQIGGLGTGVGTALGINVGSAGALVTFNGAGGTPSSMVGTNITGTAAGLTAGNVTTNANLTGDVTSVGNAATLAWISRTASQTLAIGAGGTLGSNAFTSTAYLPLTGGTLSGMLAVNLNAASAPAPITGNGIQNVAADGVTARSSNYSFAAIAAFTAARANGTGASPTAVVSGNQIGGFNSYGYATSGGAAYYGPTSSLQSFATENFTSTAQGTKIVIATTPNTTTTLTTALTIDQDQSATLVGQMNAASFVPTGSAVPTNGMYLGAANTLSFSTASTMRFFLDINGIQLANSNGAQIFSSAASGTVPTLIPRRSDGNTGVGSSVSGSLNLIAGSVTRAQISTSAASVSDILFPGSVATGGTGTTQFPQMLFQPTGTSAVTTWPTGGTIIGVNAVSGSTADFLNFHIAGGAVIFNVASSGNLISTGSISGQSLRVNSNTGLLTLGASNDLIVSRPAAATFQWGNLDVASGAVAQIATFQGNTGSTTNGPLSIIRGAGGGSSTSVGGELRLSGGLSSAAAGTGGAITGYVAPATAGNAAVLAWAVDATGVVKNSKGFTVATLPTPPAAGYYGYVTDQLTTCAAAGAAIVGGGAVTCPVFYNGVAWVGG